jgi:hypothetical protein
LDLNTAETSTLIHSDIEVRTAESTILTIADEARALDIVDDTTNAVALDLLSQVRATVKTLDAARKRYVGPLNDHVKLINADFARMSAPAEEADKILARKTSDYRAQTVAAARAEQDRLRAEAEKAQAEAIEEAAVWGTAPTIVPVPVVEAPAKTLVTAAGSTTTFRNTPHFEIIDPNQVPLEYYSIDEKKVGAAVRSGISPIAGVRIWWTEEPVVK